MNEKRQAEQAQDKFEQQLTQAMRRVDAPQGLAARIMDRAAGPAENPAEKQAERKSKVIVMRPRFSSMRLAWSGGAIAAMLMLGIFAGEQVHIWHQREQADQQFEAATRITDEALAHTREQLARAGVSLEP
jgi:hypothetical protein